MRRVTKGEQWTIICSDSIIVCFSHSFDKAALPLAYRRTASTLCPDGIRRLRVIVKLPLLRHLALLLTMLRIWKALLTTHSFSPVWDRTPEHITVWLSEWPASYHCPLPNSPMVAVCPSTTPCLTSRDGTLTIREGSETIGVLQ